MTKARALAAGTSNREKGHIAMLGHLIDGDGPSAYAAALDHLAAYPRDALIAFMKSNQIPMEQLESGKKRVLVVDDDEAIVEMFTELLERDGRFEVRTAATGYDAGILTEQFRPDVLLLDFKLPDVNGTVVCRTIRANPNYKYMQIIMISGVADPDEVAELRAAGADDFIRKPFDIKVVIQRIAELLKVA